jgi:PAS domain S-box-containing protein
MAMALKENRAIDGMEAIAERPDGTRVPFMAYPTPLRDESGRLVGAVNMLVNLTERKQAKHIEQLLASIVESSDDAILSKDLNGIITTWNQGATRLLGYAAEEIIGKSITTLIPPERHDDEAGILERIRRGERIDHYETVRRRKDGTLVEVSLTVSPVKDAAGRVIGASKIARDITERKKAAERIALLAREVDHRSKNLLALVLATVRLAQAETPEEIKATIEGRIQAIANANSLLEQSRWVGADLRDLVSEELAPYATDAGERIRVDGPSLLLEPNAARAMVMAVHELATNAVKHGALSAPTGRVRVEWSHAADGKFVFRWVEEGGPPATPPKRQGCGMSVIERMIRGQLKGDLRFDWNRNGLKCEIAMKEIAVSK